MLNNKFLDKVIEQILSETRIDDRIHTPFRPYLFSPLSLSFLVSFFLIPFPSFISHCKKVYSLNEQEIEYIWKEYKKGITALIDKKEPSHQEKRMMIHNSENNNIYGEYTNE